MKRSYKKAISVFILTAGLFCHTSVSAQEILIDQVIGVVGSNIILQSDVENQYLQFMAQGYRGNERTLKCEIFEDLLTQRLFLNQAQVDSIEVTESEVETELDRRLRVFISQVGSQERLEEYYNKSLLEIKENFRQVIRDQLLTQKMQRQLSEDIKVVPSEVRAFYRRTPTDSLPDIPEQYEIRQIVKKPEISEEAIFAVKDRLLELRKRVIDGENFATLAVLYSEDPGTAIRGGELGMTSRSDLVKEFADVAFSLRKDQVSQIVETEFGYHIIQMIERQGDRVNVRHILMKPRLTPQATREAIGLLDSLATQIRIDSIKFEQAARMFSEDEDTRMAGGILVNTESGSTRFAADQLDRPTAAAIRSMKKGEISPPFEAADAAGKQIYKIVQLSHVIPAHKASLELDYSLLQNIALSEKKNRQLNEWIKQKQAATYIRIDESFSSCPFKIRGWSGSTP